MRIQSAAVKFLCFRDRYRDGVREVSHSLVLDIKTSSFVALSG